MVIFAHFCLPHFISGSIMSWLRVHPWLDTQMVLTPGSVTITCPKFVTFCKPKFPHLQNRDASIYLTELLRVKSEEICKVQHSAWIIVGNHINI